MLSHRSALAGVVLGMILVSPLVAQPVWKIVESIEWMARDSKVVVQATVLELDFDDKRKRGVVTARSIEALKGNPGKEFKFLASNRAVGSFTEIKKNRKPILLFLTDQNPGDRTDDPKLALRGTEYDWQRSCVFLDGEKGERTRYYDYFIMESIFSAESARGFDAETILAATRAAIDFGETSKLASHQIKTDHYFVKVPVDERLEELARRSILENDKSKSGYQKENAVKSLFHFKSEQNTELIKGQLVDYRFDEGINREGWNFETRRYYPTRKVAYETLQQWRVVVKKPVIVEVVAKKEIDPAERETIAWIEKEMGGAVVFLEGEHKEDRFHHAREVWITQNKGPFDLAFVAKLPKIEKLVFDFSGLTDLSQLSESCRVKAISFNGTKVGDLGGLAEVTSLESISFANTRVSDLSPLSGLKQLQDLYVGNNVRDLSPLANLKNLQNLYISRSKVTDLSPISGLTGLQYLEMVSTAVSNLEPLRQLRGLTYIRMSQTKVSDLSPLAELVNLKQLYLDETAVTDVSPLASLSKLEHINLKNTQVKDVTPLDHINSVMLPDGTRRK